MLHYLYEKGKNVTPTEHPVKTPFSATGLLGALRALLCATGTGELSASRRFLGVLPLALVAVLIFAACPALAARGHVFERSFGARGTGAGQFEKPGALAVNEATGDVYVVDRGGNRVEYFSATGAFEGQFDGSGTFPGEAGRKAPLALEFPIAAGIAVDDDPGSPSFGDVYVASGEYGHMVVDKFSSTGAYVGQLTGTCEIPAESPPCAGSKLNPFVAIYGVAVDPSGKLWVTEEHFNGSRTEGFDSFSSAEVNMFIPPFIPTAITTKVFLNRGLAVDSKDDLYIYVGGARPGESPIRELSSTGVVLNESIDVGAEVAYDGVATESTSGDVYVDNIESVARFGPDGSPIESFGVGHLPSVPSGGCRTLQPAEEEECLLGGLTVDSSSGRVYVTDAAAGVVEVYELEPPSSPRVGGESVSDVTSGSATFTAEINPRSEPGDEATSYRFEYGPCAAPAACASSPFGSNVPVPDGRLAPNYEPDVVSAHVQGLLAGTVYHFRVFAENSRGEGEVERDKGGQEVVHVFKTQTAGVFALPDGRQWEMVSPSQKHGALIEPIDSNAEGGVIRAAADGSALAYMTNTPTESQPQGYGGYLQVLATRGAGGSSWVSRDLAIPHAAASGVSVGKGQEYRSFSEDLSLAVVQPFGSLEPALSDEASEQTAFLRRTFANGNVGEPCVGTAMHCYHPLVTGENATSGNPFGEEATCNAGSIFCGPHFVGGAPDLSHIVLDSEVALTVGGGAGLYEWTAGQLTFIGYGTIGGYGGGDAVAGARHAISNDGSRVFFTNQATGLFMRDLAREQTLKLAGVGARFEAANADGSLVFFNGEECEVRRNQTTGELECPLVGVDGELMGISEDGSWVYFTKGGSIYVSHGGATRLVSPGADPNDSQLALYNQTARVSPNGEWLAFMSEGSPTGYDNRDAVSGRPDQEVYLYNGRTERLVCASCNPTGARPHGVEYGTEGSDARPKLPLVGGDGVWEGKTWLAANIPSWTRYTLSEAVYQSRYLSDSGRLFFNSSDALVSRDVNGQEDVYEYEPEGVGSPRAGSCGVGVGSGSEVFKPSRTLEVEGRSVQEGAGCVALISAGTSGEESAFLDASETGGDVFFATASRLASQDFDNALDVYDAHECTSAVPCFSPVAAPPPCITAEGCRAAPAPQPAIFGAPSSATFSGTGNIAPSPRVSVRHRARPVKCKKGFRKKEGGKCVRKPKAKRARGSVKGGK